MYPGPHVHVMFIFNVHTCYMYNFWIFWFHNSPVLYRLIFSYIIQKQQQYPNHTWAAWNGRCLRKQFTLIYRCGFRLRCVNVKAMRSYINEGNLKPKAFPPKSLYKLLVGDLGPGTLRSEQRINNWCTFMLGDLIQHILWIRVVDRTYRIRILTKKTKRGIENWNFSFPPLGKETFHPNITFHPRRYFIQEVISSGGGSPLFRISTDTDSVALFAAHISSGFQRIRIRTHSSRLTSLPDIIEYGPGLWPRLATGTGPSPSAGSQTNGFSDRPTEPRTGHPVGFGKTFSVGSSDGRGTEPSSNQGPKPETWARWTRARTRHRARRWIFRVRRRSWFFQQRATTQSFQRIVIARLVRLYRMQALQSCSIGGYPYGRRRQGAFQMRMRPDRHKSIRMRMHMHNSIRMRIR